MPAVAGSATERSQTRRFASAMTAARLASSPRLGSGLLERRGCEPGGDLAGAGPPMPSATANSGGSKTNASSFEAPRGPCP